MNITPDPNLKTPTLPTLPPPNSLLTAPTAPPPPTPTLPVASPVFSSHSSIDIENGKRIEENGFIYISVKGDPESRGYAQGFLLADRIVKFIRTYAFFCLERIW